MDATAFYDARKVTHLSTMVEVNETTENAKNVVNVVVLRHEAGDSGSLESDVEDLADSMEENFEPAGELEVEEDFESVEESENGKLYSNFDKAILIDDDSSILRDRILNLDASSSFEIWKFLFTGEIKLFAKRICMEIEIKIILISMLQTKKSLRF